ncbi:MAG: flagellar hook-length control protein FliK [Desulfosarcina sp.]
MIPSGSFMQMAAVAVDKKTTGFGGLAQVSRGETGTSAAIDDPAGSFLTWIEKLAGGEDVEKNDPAKRMVFGCLTDVPDPNGPNALKRLIVDAMESAGAQPGEREAWPQTGPDPGQQLSPRIPAPLIVCPDGSSSDPTSARQSGAASQALFAPSADDSRIGPHPMAAGLSSSWTSPPDSLGLVGQEGSAFPGMPPTENGAIGSGQNHADRRVPGDALQGEEPFEAIRVAADRPDRDLSLDPKMEASAVAEQESAEADLGRVPTAHRHPSGDAPRPPDAIAAVAADGESMASEEEAADAKGNPDPHQPQSRHRPATADIQASHLDISPPSDAAKISLNPGVTANGAVQDHAAVLGPEPSIHASDRQPIGQTTGLIRPDESSARAFQSTVMDQIVDKAAMRSIHGRSEIQIRLKPDFLGNVQMNIAADKEQLVVRIITDQPIVKEIIETHLHQLKAELQNQGLTIDKFDVTVNPEANQQHGREPFAQAFKQQSLPNGRRPASPQHPDASDHDENRPGDRHSYDRDRVNYFA